ncbi:Thyroid adenoma-associated protein-like 1 [Homarus americanus]|uniref:Thyroid adenoma-associated protein-like 1 n=1 Tax=Homarus americanus TaxID=6706 RepID=A0A8J5JEN8_HOMAM|nr:Thyroid adenoma-associated protein-like 1 [Homarus americanus]
MLSTLHELQLNDTGKHSECSVEGVLESFKKGDKPLRERLGDIKPAYPVALLLHGLFNSDVQWIYNYGNWSDIFLKLQSAPGKEHGNDSYLDYNPSSRQCDKQPHPQDSNVGEVGGIFLYEIYIVIRKLCKGATSYTFQAFQVLRLWLTCVRELGNRMRKDYDEVLTQHFQECSVSEGCNDYNLYHYKKNLPSGKWIFTTLSNQDTVFHLLNSNWENPSKGVSDVVYVCMVELLELHEDDAPDQAKSVASSMVMSLSSSDAWTSKSTYPPLALAVSYIGAQKAVMLCPRLPTGLMTSLSVNHLAPAGTKVYKIMVEGLTSCLWSEYFFTIVCEALHSDDRLTQQNVRSLWLPPTLRQYPRIYLELLSGCEDTTGGWVARMAILRVARSLGSLSLKEHDTALDHEELSNLHVQKSFSSLNAYSEIKGSSSSVSVENEYYIKKQVINLCVLSYLKPALSHLDETVRGEALSFLCHTRKASEPVSLEESSYLKWFFKYNMNIDSAPFRQGMIKCYKALVARLRDASATELKKLSFRVLNSKDYSSEFVRNLKANPVLQTNTELLVWFIKLFHSNLAPDGNYQRRILSLLLYKETLLAFYEKKTFMTYSVPPRYMTVCAYINLTNSKEVCDEESQPITDLSLPWTLEMLLCSCLDEMNNIRDEAENILKIMESSKNAVCYYKAEEWLQRGLTLCNSPKASDAESGATLVKVVSSSYYNGGHDISTLLKALGRCVFEEAHVAPLLPEDVQDFVHKLASLMVKMVEFMLSKLACASQNGSAVAPSFAEMGDSVELIIKECGGSTAPAEFYHSECGEDIEERDEEADDEDNAISGDHQLVLACCWQTMKTCCMVSSMCLSRWLDCLSETVIEKLLRCVVVRVLTGYVTKEQWRLLEVHTTNCVMFYLLPTLILASLYIDRCGYTCLVSHNP